MFILKTMDGNKFKITEKEYQATIVGDGLLVFSSCGITINKSRIESIYPENMADQIQEKKEQKTGRLHDGTRVRRHFGEWVDAEFTAVDDRGNTVPVRIDPVYYPEVSRDCVATEEEYEKIKSLPTAEKIKMIIGDIPEKRGQSDFTKLIV